MVFTDYITIMQQNRKYKRRVHLYCLSPGDTFTLAHCGTHTIYELQELFVHGNHKIARARVIVGRKLNMWYDYFFDCDRFCWI